ncbi:MAG: hypothetical protein E5V75_05010 [Mesorhizobium sp.]|nr:MAG: hypothetical protein E5V75_05010 [Mesorhizobium sp.]
MIATPHVEPVEEDPPVGVKRKRRTGPPKPREPLTEEWIEELTVGYLSTLISAHLKRHVYPEIPQEIRPILQLEIDAAGGLIPWARNHPSFPRLMEIKRAAKGAKKTIEVVKVGDGPKALSALGNSADNAH